MARSRKVRGHLGDARIRKPKNWEAIFGKPESTVTGVSKQTIEDIRNEIVRRRPNGGYSQPTQEEYEQDAYEYLMRGGRGETILMIRDQIIKKRVGGIHDAIAKVKEELGL
ncbi:MAG: hypothetical protein RMY34_23315 [Aulosira sp. DedQUE10]|nr:hypothetical protein [Aulosira sp. DedQUE10]